MERQELIKQLDNRCNLRLHGTIIHIGDPLFDLLVTICKFPGVVKFLEDYIVVWQRNGEKVTVTKCYPNLFNRDGEITFERQTT